MSYSNKVLDHYENLRNVGPFGKSDARVGTCMVGAPACGDVMRLQIRISDDGVIEDVKFKTYGLRFAHRIRVTRHGMGQGQDSGPSTGNQEHRNRRGVAPATGQGALLGARRRRHQGGNHRLSFKTSFGCAHVRNRTLMHEKPTP